MLLDMEKYPVSFWNYVETGALGKEEVAKWKELGVNLAMSFEYDPKKHKKEQMTEMLDECARLGLKVVVCDARSHWNALKEQGRGAFIEGLNRLSRILDRTKPSGGSTWGTSRIKACGKRPSRRCACKRALRPGCIRS